MSPGGSVLVSPDSFRAADRWLRLGRRAALPQLALVLAMQVLGGDPEAAYVTALCTTNLESLVF